jgi:ABC-2 type transport system ATP-binding protein
MQRQPVITTNGLTRRFGDVVAVDHLSLEVWPGEIFGFLGHNGAGKTTTVRLLNGVLTADEGTARVLERDPVAEGPILRRSTGILTETPSLDERLTGRENLRIYADLYGVSPVQVPKLVNELLDVFELAHRADDKVSGYSKGMKQRLALARALLHSPELLFLDEPTAGLDPVAARRVHTMIVRLSEEEQRTVFLCTHNLEEAQRLCDRVAVLEHGRLVALGTPSELARQLGRSQRLEIQVSPDSVQATGEVLKASLGTATAAKDDQVFTIVGADRETIPDLVASLVAAGVRVYRVTPQEPSLEDIYFALHDETAPNGIQRQEVET